MDIENWVLVDTGPDGGVARASGKGAYMRLLRLAEKQAGRPEFDPSKHSIKLLLAPEQAELYDASTLKASRVAEWADDAAKKRAQAPSPTE